MAGRHVIALCVAIACSALASVPARGQELSAVTVPDSPTAWQLFQQANDQARDNPSQAARLCQRLLDGFADRVIPAEGETGDRFESVLERVERFLLDRPSTLERYRQMEGPEAERIAEAEGPGQVARSRGLTLAGLRAHLALAEREFRVGSFDPALARLRRIERHPDLDDPALSSMYWYLRGASAALLDRVAEREDAIARLRAIATPEAAASVTAIERMAEVEPASVPAATGVLDRGVASAVSGVADGFGEGEWQQIWRRELPGTAFSRLFAVPDAVPTLNNQVFPFGDIEMTTVPRQFERARFDGSMLSVAPTLVGDQLILSDGTEILSIDSLSHRVRWRHPIGADAPEAIPSGELAAVGVGDGVVVASTSDTPTGIRSLSGRMACVDVATGQLLWQRDLATLQPPEGSPADAFESLVPIGAPAVADGAVHQLCRRVTPQLETLEYLISLDARTGEQRFASFLCSSGGMPRFGARLTSRPIVADGAVWVATGVGAVSCIDATDGRTRWVHRFLVPMRNERYAAEPWEISSPVLLGEHLWFVTPDQTEVVQLERSTGRRIASFPTGAGSTWGTPRYLLGDDGQDMRAPRIYSVGGDLVAIDPDDPGRALWSLLAANALAFESRQGLTNRVGMRGRVQVAGDALLVPGLSDLLFVDRNSGRAVGRVEIEGPANPLLVGSQLFLGQNESVCALMPEASAERMMRERIASSPGNPEGGLALLDLGLRTGRIGLCLDAARSARDALDGVTTVEAEAARLELVERLLRALRLEGASQPDGDELLSVLGQVASMPSDRVRFLLASADRNDAQARPAQAIASLDAILADRRLSAVEVADASGTIRPAAALAIERLGHLGVTAPGAFAAREATARTELARASGDAGALRALSRRAIGTPSSYDAALALAGLLSQRGHATAALGVLTDALRSAPAGSPASRALVEASMRLAETHGWQALSRELADVAVDRAPDAVGPAGESMADVAGANDPVTRVGLVPGKTVALDGRLVGTPATGDAQRALGGVLLVSEGELHLVDAPTLERRWSAPMVDPEPRVLAVGGAMDDSMLVWETGVADARGPVATRRRLTDGAQVDATLPMASLLPVEQALDAGRPVLQAMPDGEQFDPNEFVPALAGRILVVVRRNGDMVAFDVDRLGEPLWTARRALDQVYGVTASDVAIVLHGRVAPDSPYFGGDPAVVAIDPHDGALVGRAHFMTDDDITWTRLAPTGELVVGTGSSIEAFDVLAPFVDRAILGPTDDADATLGQTAGRLPTIWRSVVASSRQTLSGWRFASWILTIDRAELLTALSLRDGATHHGVFVPPARALSRGGQLRTAGRVGDVVVVQFEDRVLSFARDGQLLGDDAVVDDGSYVFAVPLADRVLAIRTPGGRQVPYPLTGGMRTEFPYLVYRLDVAAGCRLEGPALQVRLTGQRCDRVAAADGVLFFSTALGTVAVPLPVAP